MLKSHESIVILLREDTLLCWRTVGNAMHDLVQFPIEPEPLFAWLKNFPNPSVQLVVDTLAEEVYIEPSPMLFPWEQDDFAQRHLRRRFPKTDFNQYRFDTSKAYPWESRSGLLLVSGFNEDQQLITLLSWLQSAEVAVTAIYSAALLLPRLFKEVWFSHPKQANIWHDKAHFVLSRTGVDSFRQYLIVDGNLRTVRQIQLRDQSLSEQMEQLLQEIRMLDKFVHSQKMIGYDITPDLYYLGATEEDTAVAWQIFESSPYASAGRGAFVATKSIAHFEGWHAADTDLIMMLAFGQRLDASDYLPPSVQKALHYQQAHNGFWALFFALAIAFVTYLVYFFVQTEGYANALASLHTQHTRYQQHLVQLQSQLDITIPVDQLKNMVETVEHIQSTSTKQVSLPYFVDLSQVLNNYPSIHVQELVWMSQSPSQTNKKLDQESYDVVVSAVIAGNESTRLRHIMDTMDSFLKELKQKPSIAQVELLQKPVDLDSSRSITIIAEDSKEAKGQIYPFRLSIRFRRLP